MSKQQPDRVSGGRVLMLSLGWCVQRSGGGAGRRVRLRGGIGRRSGRRRVPGGTGGRIRRSRWGRRVRPRAAGAPGARRRPTPPSARDHLASCPCSSQRPKPGPPRLVPLRELPAHPAVVRGQFARLTEPGEAMDDGHRRTPRTLVRRCRIQPTAHVSHSLALPPTLNTVGSGQSWALCNCGELRSDQRRLAMAAAMSTRAADP